MNVNTSVRDGTASPGDTRPFLPGTRVLVSPGAHTLWPDVPVRCVVADGTPSWCDLVDVVADDGTRACVFPSQVEAVE